MTQTYDFGYGPVPAHQHPNGGGWVADTATVAETAYIGPNALVSGSALVSGNALVTGNARVTGNAWVSGNARVTGSAWVSGSAWVYGSALVTGNALVSGIRRSDGYAFVYVPCQDGKHRVIAGCRYFTMKEARKHWQRTRGGTPLGDETMAILDCLEILSKIKPEGAV